MKLSLSMSMAQNNYCLNVLLWNANSIIEKIDELYYLMTTKNIHIACICETFLKPHCKLSAHNDFIVHRIDRAAGRGGGVAIIIRRCISHKILPHIKTNIIENISIEVFDDKNRSFIVSSVYLPGGTSHNTIKQHFANDIRKLTNHRKPFYLCGDLNSRHRMWNCVNANQAGKILYNEQCMKNFLIKFPNEFTYHPNRSRGNPSTIDLVITNGLHEVTDFNCIPLSSDHMGVNFRIRIGEKFKASQTESTYNYNLADWDNYRMHIHHHAQSMTTSLDDICSTNDIDNLIDNFNKLIKAAQEKSVPTTTKSKQRLVLPDEIIDVIKLKNSLRKQWQMTRDPFIKSLINHYEKTIKTRIKEIKNEEFRWKLSSIRPSHVALWQTAKLIKNDNHLPPLKRDNDLLISAKEKAEALGELFYQNHCNPLSNDNLLFTQHVDNIVNFPLPVAVSSISFTDDDEIILIIKGLKNNKAPGNDSINNKLLRHLPARGIKIISIIINGCLKLSYFPAIWKIAKVVPIHKHGKDKSDINSYRPISLLCSMSKILEKVLLTRINHHLDENEILPEEQHGFRANYSTTKQLHKMISMARQNLNSKKSTGMLMLDVEKAFDRVWHNGLIFKLISLLFPTYLISMVKEFLTMRKFFVSIKGNNSSLFNIPFGLAQGAVLSPTLYNIYTCDLPKNEATNIHLYADDVSFNSSHRNFLPIQKALTLHAKHIESFMRKWKIKINGNKTQAIFVSNRRTKQVPLNEINVLNSSVIWNSEVKYLGVVIDKKLTFNHHIEHILRKANTAIHTLHPLLNSNSSLCVENKLLLYKLAIRPIITYASPAYIESLAESHKKKLQILQNKVLKLIFGLERRTRTNVIHEMANVPTVEEFNLKLLSNFKRKHNI